MCLHFNVKTLKIPTRCKETWITGWKIVKPFISQDNQLHLKTLIFDSTIKPGILARDEDTWGDGIRYKEKYDKVSGKFSWITYPSGIHVYFKKPTPDQVLLSTGVLLQVKYDVRDLLARGHEGGFHALTTVVVVKKIKVSRRQYKTTRRLARELLQRYGYEFNGNLLVNIRGEILPIQLSKQQAV